MDMPLASLASIEAEALKLTSDERALLVDRLVASIAGEFAFEREWQLEVARRDAAIETGAAGTVSLDDALVRARRAIA